jgi:hypothetical protein
MGRIATARNRFGYCLDMETDFPPLYVVISIIAILALMVAMAVLEVVLSPAEPAADPDVDVHRLTPVDTGASPDFQGVADTEDDTGLHQCAPVDSGATPVCTGGERLIFDAVRTPKEHAIKLVEQIRTVGRCGQAIHQGELEDLHCDLCNELGWDWPEWVGVGRELKKLPGVRKDQVRHEGRRLTVYEISAADTVVDLAAAAHKRTKK